MISSMRVQCSTDSATVFGDGEGYQVRALPAWFHNGAALNGRCECALKHVRGLVDINLDAAGRQRQQQTNKHVLKQKLFRAAQLDQRAHNVL